MLPNRSHRPREFRGTFPCSSMFSRAHSESFCRLRPATITADIQDPRLSAAFCDGLRLAGRCATPATRVDAQIRHSWQSTEEVCCPTMVRVESRVSLFVEDSMESVAVTTRMLRLKEVVRITGLARMTIWRLERKGDFPPRRQLGPRCVAWRESDVYEWIRLRPVARPVFSRANEEEEAGRSSA
jgi:prophage regulatory protein